MRVRISFTIDIDDLGRRVLSHYYHQTGLASRSEVVRFFSNRGLDGWIQLGDHESVYMSDTQEKEA